jgi:hypothetical protein
MQVGGRRGTSNLQYRDCRHAKEEIQKRKLQKATETTMGKVFSSGHTTPRLTFAAALCNNTQQHQQPQPPSAAQPCPATVGETSTPPPLRHNHQQIASQLVQAPNANSSSVNDIFKVVTATFQHIMIQLIGAESEDRITVLKKILLKVMKQNSH